MVESNIIIIIPSTPPGNGLLLNGLFPQPPRQRRHVRYLEAHIGRGGENVGLF